MNVGLRPWKNIPRGKRSEKGGLPSQEKKPEGEGVWNVSHSSCPLGRLGGVNSDQSRGEMCSRTGLYPYPSASLCSLLHRPSARDTGPEKDAKNSGHKLFSNIE